MQKTDAKPGKNPFKVPDNYFEEVNRKILSATTDNVQAEIKIVHHTRFRTYLAIAAGIAVFVLFGYVTSLVVKSNKTETNVSEVIATDSYNENFINDIDLQALEENAAQLDIAAVTPDVSKSDIVDYLLQENLDINEIYQQF